ncbi:MAG: amidohydrolase family protein [Bradymonadia bacterium]
MMTQSKKMSKASYAQIVWALFMLLPSTSVSTPIIDVHVHTSTSYFGPLLKLLGSYGISRYVNLSGGFGERLVDSLEAAAPLEPQVAVCTNIDWSNINGPDFSSQTRRALERAKALGARCIKISKALGLYITVKDSNQGERLLELDDPRLNEIWSTAGRLRLPIFIHTGDPKAFFEPLTPENERYHELSLHPDWSFYGPQFPSRDDLLEARSRVFAQHPTTQFIAVHFANNPEDLDYVDRLLSRYPNVCVDLAARLPEIGRHPPRLVREVFIRHQKRILFGTDLGFSPRQIMLGSVGENKPVLHDIFEFYAVHERWLTSNDRAMPHPTPIQGNWTIDAIALPPAVLENIYWRNALRVIWHSQPDAEQEERLLMDVPSMSVYYPN